MNTATKIQDLGAPWVGNASLYMLEPPMKHDEDGRVSFVIVSGSAKPPGPPEVAAFDSTSTGQAKNLGETLARVQHTLDHAAALRALGYVLGDG